MITSEWTIATAEKIDQKLSVHAFITKQETAVWVPTMENPDLENENSNTYAEVHTYSLSCSQQKPYRSLTAKETATAQTFEHIIHFLRKHVTEDKQQCLEHIECTLWLFTPV